MTHKQNQILAALLVEPSQPAAAKRAGVSLSTLRRYLADPDFQRVYDGYMNDMVHDAAAQGKRLLGEALTTLKEIMDDKGQNAQVRVTAARSVLEYGLKLVEASDVLTRLDALEKAVDEK